MTVGVPAAAVLAFEMMTCWGKICFFWPWQWDDDASEKERKSREIVSKKLRERRKSIALLIWIVFEVLLPVHAVLCNVPRILVEPGIRENCGSGWKMFVGANEARKQHCAVVYDVLGEIEFLFACYSSLMTFTNPCVFEFVEFEENHTRFFIFIF